MHLNNYYYSAIRALYIFWCKLMLIFSFLIYLLATSKHIQLYIFHYLSGWGIKSSLPPGDSLWFQHSTYYNEGIVLNTFRCIKLVMFHSTHSIITYEGIPRHFPLWYIEMISLKLRNKFINWFMVNVLILYSKTFPVWHHNVHYIVAI